MPVRLMIAYGLMALIAVGFMVMVLSIRYHSLSQKQERARKLAKRKQDAYEFTMAEKDVSQ